jgi:2,3-bisphosphoglycerate-independent phosphoglycerate mutase
VGLPDQQMGNSEVGHLDDRLGAHHPPGISAHRPGRAGRQHRPQRGPANHLADQLLASGQTLHLIGLCSNGGVHSHVNHVGGLLKWAAERGLKDICIHITTDGRDTPTQSAPGFIASLESQIAAAAVGRLSTICGRYWAMDRDNRWDRTEKAYRLLTQDDGASGLTALQVVEASGRRRHHR